MKNVNRLVSIVCLLGVCAIAPAHADGELRVQPVAGSIHMISGKGGNVGLLLGPDGTFLIDDQFAHTAPALRKAIESVGGGTPRFLLNTHFHGDHAGGNAGFAKSGANIVAHENVRMHLQKGYEIAVFNKSEPPAPQAALPVITYNQSLSLHLNSEQIVAIHVPNAHTDGDTIVHFQNSNVLHAGDVFFNGFFPFVDAAHGGSLPGLIRAVDTLLLLADDKTRIIPGHGPLAVKEDLQAYRRMLQTAHDRLAKLSKAGLSVEEAVARKPLADLNERWGKVMFTADRWIPLVYGTI